MLPPLLKLVKDWETSAIIFVSARLFGLSCVLVELILALDSCIRQQLKGCRRIVSRNQGHSVFYALTTRRETKGDEGGKCKGEYGGKTKGDEGGGTAVLQKYSLVSKLSF